MRKWLLICCLFFVHLPSAFATSWAYPFVIYNETTYAITDEQVAHVEQKIGEVTSYSTMEQLAGNFSNYYPVGTNYYALTDIPIEEAIAIQVGESKFIRADNMSQKEEQSSELADLPIQQSSLNWYMWIVIVLTVVVLALIFHIANKEKNRHRK